MTTEERLENLEKELARAKRRNRRLLAVAGLVAGAFALVWIVADAGRNAQADPFSDALKDSEGPRLNLQGRVPAPKGSLLEEVVREREGSRPATQGGGVANVIRARSFILVDENGKTRAGLNVDKDGPGLWLTDEKGKMRAVLNVDKDGPGLDLYDENNKPRARLGVIKDGPGLVLTDEKGKGSVGLTVEGDEPTLAFLDENGKPRVGMNVTKKGPMLQLRDEQDRLRAGLLVNKNGPMLRLCDENGKNRAGLLVNKDESILLLSDEGGKIRALLNASESAPSLMLYDKNDKPRAKLVVVKEGPGLVLYDENGKPRVGGVVTKYGPGLDLLDENGKKIDRLQAKRVPKKQPEANRVREADQDREIVLKLDPQEALRRTYDRLDLMADREMRKQREENQQRMLRGTIERGFGGIEDAVRDQEW